MDTNEMIAILRISDDPQKLAAADELAALLAEEDSLQARSEQLEAENARLTAAHEAAADELARVVQELREAREALECTFNWAMTEESDPNGGFDIFAEEIVPMIGKVLGRE